MKKLLALILALMLLFCVTACCNNTTGNIPEESETPISEAPEEVECAKLGIDYASEELLSDSSAYTEFIADDSEYQVKAVITSDTEIKDVRVLSIEFADAGDDGELEFSANELYTLDRLTPEKPLVVGMVFLGDIPNMGIAYTDACGNEHVYSISMSGMDGSLLLSEITII